MLIWHTALMSSTKHREGAKLDRVPLPVEAARVAVTGWQVTRTGARILSKLPGRGPWQQKVIRQLPQTFADLAMIGLSQEHDTERQMERLAEETLKALNDRATMGQAVGVVAGSLDVHPERARLMISLYSRRLDRRADELARSIIEGRVDLKELMAVYSETT